MQGTGFDEHEIGDQRAHLGNVLDATDERRESRIVLIDDGRALRAAVVDQHIHLITPQRGSAPGTL